MENIENFLQNLDIESNMVKSEIMKDLKEIIKQIECRKEFNCLTSGLRNQCKAKDIGLESYIECDPET
ncbi:MAG TPA: hypothetical protein EYP30_04395, partial [Archaeoglobaceae archaeon]|nr:hypothetical protein [Archaeoglobaceae archaeon]